MTIFADLCVHKDLLLSLQEAGYKVISAREVKLFSVSDQAVYDYTVKNKHILLTLDKDFSNVLRFNIPQSSGIVIIYIEDMNKEEVIGSCIGVFKNYTASQLNGKLFIVEKNKIRIWPK